MKYEAKGAYTIKSPQQLGVDGNDGPREAEGLEGACWGVCGFWIVKQGDERDALVALGSCVCEFWLTRRCGTMRPCVTRVYQSCVIDITTVTAPRHTSRGSRRRGVGASLPGCPSHVPLRRHRSHGGILYMPLSVGGEESAKPGKKSHLLSGAPLAGLCALSEVATGLCAPVRRAPGSPRHRNPRHRLAPSSCPFSMLGGRMRL